jgi:hypothetical protein
MQYNLQLVVSMDLIGLNIWLPDELILEMAAVPASPALVRLAKVINPKSPNS